jgi:hypothetical protein
VTAAALVLSAQPKVRKKLSTEEKIEILRGMTAEFATVKTLLPRSKKPLEFNADGNWDKEAWEDAQKELGPAARAGDQVQITKIQFEDDRFLLEINGGVKSGRKWYENVEVGVGARTTPVGRGGNPTAGTNLALVYKKPLAGLTSAELKKALKPVMDFEKRSATENYVESLPEPVQAAIKEKRAVEGMTREQVVISMGRPRTKQREMVDGVELEDWIYGLPPGKITFVTFDGDKVVKVKESYAGLGGSTAPTLKPQ